ncbi:MDR family MFS transporter [uncultured Pseudokineococcus sp.]|uniref:MDR family MFS transporter n=1 Tax=uncultured Pseudokineococcus sp. TaxID=1642928 RepID=UPI0026128FEC|nr:MDR family MFS transporter [uncultured Pseudokineococcus sp.]
MSRTSPAPAPAGGDPAPTAPERRQRAAAAEERRRQRAAASAPAGEDGGFSHRQVLTVLGGLMLGMFLAALDQTVVSTAIRTIADDLQGYDLQAWATTAFLITSTISTPLYGKLSDIYGRRPFYLGAIAVFVLGSALCGVSTSMYELAAWRAVQGVGAGGLMSLALAIIADLVPPRERSRYQGYFMAVFGTSSVLGPVIGGFFAGRADILGLDGWRWIFWVNVPLGLLAFTVVARVLHLPHERREHRIDVAGALALVLFLVPLLVVAEQGRTWGWGSGGALLAYGLGAVGLVAFVLAERRIGDDALLPLALFANRTFLVGGLGSVVVGMGMFGGLLLLPQYLQIVGGSTPTEAGLQMVPLVLGIMTGALSSGIAISRTGRYKVFPVTGAVLLTVALLSLSRVIGADTPYWQLVPFMVLTGLGLGFNFQPVVLAVQNAAGPRQTGVATSSVTFFRQMGGTLGTAVFLSVLFTRLPGDIRTSVQEAAAADPQLASRLQDVPTGQGALSDTSFIQQLPDAVAAPFRAGFSTSIDAVLLIAACVVAVGIVVMAFLPQVELRSQSGLQARAADGGARPDAGPGAGAGAQPEASAPDDRDAGADAALSGAAALGGSDGAAGDRRSAAPAPSDGDADGEDAADDAGTERAEAVEGPGDAGAPWPRHARTDAEVDAEPRSSRSAGAGAHRA